jgi:succinoglycan biosynthesis protein ExoV
MLLYHWHWRGVARNFGDELNLLLWPRLLPGLLDDDPAELFLGIGSVLDARHARDAVKLVAGAGYGGYAPLPVLDARWVIHWVRGPRTACQLGLAPAYGLGDPAMLLPQAGWGRIGGGDTIAFMPHFESAERGAWVEAATEAGIELIDPRDDPAAIIAAIGRCRVLLSEAMHGVIVADALRVPWIAVQPLSPQHRAKWHDWADTLDLHIEFHQLTPSSLRERLRASPLAALHSGYRLLDRFGSAFGRLTRGRLVGQAAQSLAAAAAAAPQLSTAPALDRCQTRMLERLEALRRNPLQPAALQPCYTSAYHG